MKKARRHPVQQSKKAFKASVVEFLGQTQKEVLSIKREMNEEIERQMNERHGDLIHQVQSTLDGIIAIKELLIKEGSFTREEYNEQKAKMRKK